MTQTEKTLFALIKYGLGSVTLSPDFTDVDWGKLFDLSERQGVNGIAIDGLERMKIMNPAFQQNQDRQSLSTDGLGLMETSPKLEYRKFQWIGRLIQMEQVYNQQWWSACKLASLWHKEGIQTYVMKGFTLACMYPNPSHRISCDMDCCLLDDYEKGNKLAEEAGLSCDRSYYKNSAINAYGLKVENHQYLIPVKGSGKAKKFEKQLRTLLPTDKPMYIGNSYLRQPSPIFNVIYVLAHAQEHFLNEGLLLKHICDWAMLLRLYSKEDNAFWNEWKRICKEQGLLEFGYALSKLSDVVCGVLPPFVMPSRDCHEDLVLNDILQQGKKKIEREDTNRRIQIVGNIMRNSWKFKYFSDTNAFAFACRRVMGFLFDRG